jgi:hypothetical protein
LDVDKEFHKMNAWCSTNGKMPSRRRFVNWLNRSEKPISNHREAARNGESQKSFNGMSDDQILKEAL